MLIHERLKPGSEWANMKFNTTYFIKRSLFFLTTHTKKHHMQTFITYVW